jgi:branched-chain amino acid transport system permease protein
MSELMNDSSSLPAPPPWSFDPRRLGRLGGLAGLTMAFICLIGMPVKIDTVPLIERHLSRGYTSLVWVPVVFGFIVASQVVLEGMQARKRGLGDIIDGTVVGGIGGFLVGLLAWLINNYDIRDPLINWSPALYDFLSFSKGTGFAFFIWTALGLGLGAVGAGLQVLPTAYRRIATWPAIAIVSVSVLEAAFSDLLENLKLEFVADAIYAKQRGVTVKGAIILAVLAAIVAFGRDRVKTVVASANANGTVLPGAALLNNVAASTRKKISTTLLVVAIFVVPLFLGRIMHELLANVGLFILLALGLNVVVGLAGILDLGYVAFFAVGGYTTAVLTSPFAPWWAPELPWFVSLIVVMIVAALVGLIIGAPVIRMRGDYLAIVTLGFGEIIRLLFLSDWLSPYFGGAQGITNIPGVEIGVTTIKGTDPRAVFYLVMVFCIVAIYASWRLENSRLGRAWMAIREDESVAEAMGINTVNAKLAAFVTGAVLASFSGAIFAAKAGSIFPGSFKILVSVILLVVVIVGGMGRIAGVMVGAAVLIGVLGGPSQPGLLQEFGEYKLLVYGVLLVLMMLKRPEGLLPNVRRSRELHGDELTQDVWIKAQIEMDEEDNSATTEGEVAPA